LGYFHSPFILYDDFTACETSGAKIFLERIYFSQKLHPALGKMDL